MAEKRYVIVRADRFCPRDLERNYNLKCIGSLHCDKCDLRKKYGDTKEQMILKVAQVMLRKFIANYLMNGVKPKLADEQIQIVYKNYLEIAKEIVEFLGVEE